MSSTGNTPVRNATRKLISLNVNLSQKPSFNFGSDGVVAFWKKEIKNRITLHGKGPALLGDFF